MISLRGLWDFYSIVLAPIGRVTRPAWWGEASRRAAAKGRFAAEFALVRSGACFGAQQSMFWCAAEHVLVRSKTFDGAQH